MGKLMEKEKAARPRRAKSFDNVMSQYLSSLRRYPLLEHSEVVELFQVLEDDVAGAGAKKRAREKLIQSNLRLVISVAKTYGRYRLPIEDVIQEGNIGLMKAIERFDWKRGYRFSTYATWWIRQAIGQHVLKNRRMIRMPAHAVTIQRKMAQATAKYREQFGQDPTLAELSDLTGASQTVIKATIHGGNNTISLQSPAFVSSGGDCEKTLERTIPDETIRGNPMQIIAERQLLDLVKQVMSELTPKEEAVLRLRFGLVEDSTDSDQYPVTDAEMREIMSGKGLR